MLAADAEPSFHTEEELWEQVISLSRELQECKARMHSDTLERITDKIEGIEKELDILLDILKGDDDKKSL